MGKLRIVEATGFTKEQAFENSGLAGKLSLKYDATTAHKKDGKPTGRHLDLFATEYVEKKVKGAAGIAFSITLESGVADTRERPYKVTNIATQGSRQWKTVYHVIVGADKNGLGGVTVLSKDTKNDAEEAGKEYVTKNKVKVDVFLGKEVIGAKAQDGTLLPAQALAMTIDYTPSINTTEGKYIFFGIEAE